jgi:hypothetical protein
MFLLLDRSVAQQSVICRVVLWRPSHDDSGLIDRISRANQSDVHIRAANKTVLRLCLARFLFELDESPTPGIAANCAVCDEQNSKLWQIRTVAASGWLRCPSHDPNLPHLTESMC